jgi:DNA-binding MarR family transcriptional regulator
MATATRTSVRIPTVDLLAIVSGAVEAHVLRALSLEGYDDIRPAHLPVFLNIDEQEGSRLTALAAGARLRKQSMGYLVAYLEEHSYIERAPDPVDGRARTLRLTSRGLGAAATYRAAVLNVEEAWTRVLGKREAKQLRQFLKQLVAAAESPPAPRPRRKK